MRFGARHSLIALCAVFIAELGGLGALHVRPTVTSADPGPFRGVTADLAQAGQQLGIPWTDMTRLQVRWGLPPGLRQPRPGFITAAYHQGHIYIGRTARPSDPLAYEYLHDVWAHVSPEQRARLIPLLNAYYTTNRKRLEPSFSRVVKADVANGDTVGAARLDELHSLACSRTEDDHLDPALRSYCNFVLPGRRVTKKPY